MESCVKISRISKWDLVILEMGNSVHNLFAFYYITLIAVSRPWGMMACWPPTATDAGWSLCESPMTHCWSTACRFQGDGDDKLMYVEGKIDWLLIKHSVRIYICSLEPFCCIALTSKGGSLCCSFIRAVSWGLILKVFKSLVLAFAAILHQETLISVKAEDGGG